MMADIYLEITTGAGIVPEFICMIILIRYLGKEARRRHFHFLNWFALPAQMDLAVAMFMFNLGVLINSSVIWAWRRFFEAGMFTLGQMFFLGLGRTLILLGAIHTTKALTKPDLGNKPWILTWLATILVMIFMIWIR